MRMVGVLRTPRATFGSIASAPRWAAVLGLTFAVTFACGAILLETEVGRLALVDQWERTALAFGQTVDDTRYLAFEDASRSGTLYAALSALVSGPLVAFSTAALFFGVFTGLLHGAARFVQVLAVVAHAGVILALRQIVATPLNYARESLTSPTTMNVFFRGLDEASPIARFLGVVDLFMVWWVVALALGVSVLYKRPARLLVLCVVGAYVVLAVLLTLAMALAGGTP
jgi:hypothetical protein